MKLRQPMNPVVQNALIMLTSGLVASVLCAKVYGATLPGGEADKASATAPVVAALPQAPAQTNPVLALIGSQGPIAANGIQVTPTSGR